MPKVSAIQSNFNGGEISPLVYGRVEVPRYKESLAICQNYVPTIQGPITRRPGTGFVFPTKDSGQARLIPFEFSTTQAYVIEFGNQYIRFFKNNAIITSSTKTITGVTKANPAVVTSNAHGFSNGDRVVIRSVVGMTELNNLEFTVANVAANTFELSGVNSSAYTTYASGGTASKIYEIVSPYSTSHLAGLKFAQSNDIIYIAHPDFMPNSLSRSSDTNWSLYSTVFSGGHGTPFNSDGPYYPRDEQGVTLTYTVPAAVPTLTASSTTSINGGSGFLAGDVNRIFRIRKTGGTVWTWGQILTVTSTTVVRITWLGDTSLTAADVADSWQLGFWSDTDGWPSCVVFHEDRLVFGGAGGLPNRFDGSYAGDYQNFAHAAQVDDVTTASNAYFFALSANDFNAIRWMTSDEQGMLLGTTGGEWLVTGSDPTSALSALSVSAKRTTSFGSEDVQAVQAGKCSLFVQRGGRKLRELNYYFDVNGFRAADLTQLAEHITKSTISFLSIQKSPQPILWAVRADGVLLSMTYERELDALKVGWARHVLGGTSAVVESLAIIPSVNGESEDVWIIVKRTVNGQTVRYVEYITQFFDSDTALVDAFFVDSGLTYDSTSTSTISGLNHLNGQVVSILADGAVQADKTVVAGRVTLDAAASVVHLGLAYNSDGQKLRTDAGAADGTAMGKTRRTHRLGILFLNTLGFKLGPDFDALDDITLDSADDGNFDEAQGLYSGIYSASLSTDYDFDNMICWRQSQPLPGTIQGLYPQMVTQDRG